MASEMPAFTVAGYVRGVLQRTKLEFFLVLASWPWVLIKVIFVAYVVQLPLRNFAYYRHQQGPTLKDLGFQWIPEMKREDKWISELVIQVLHTIAVFSLVMPWLSPYAHAKNTYGVRLADKWLNSLCVAHTLRFFTYISTTLPGPADHCRLGAREHAMYQPTTLSEILTRETKGDDLNCGDLVFSGHVFQNVILSILVTSNVGRLYEWKWPRRYIPVAMWGLSIAQVPLVISARNHYSVDVVVALYLAPLIWIALERFYVSKQFERARRFVIISNPKTPTLGANAINSSRVEDQELAVSTGDCDSAI
jgi:hypothetical protein